MSLFGKKDDRKLPDLPMPKEAGLSFGLESEKHALPSFPDSPTSNKFSQAMIKDAFSHPDNRSLPTLPPPSMPPITNAGKDEKKIKVVEMDDWQSSTQMDKKERVMEDEDEDNEDEKRFMPPERSLPRVEQNRKEDESRIPRIEDRMRSSMTTPMKSHSQNEVGKKEVFVRIDRYYTARKMMSEIAAKLEDIDDMVRKIREVKLREEQEIAAWEKDIMAAKERIQEINNNLFEKLE